MFSNALINSESIISVFRMLCTLAAEICQTLHDSASLLLPQGSGTITDSKEELNFLI